MRRGCRWEIGFHLTYLKIVFYLLVIRECRWEIYSSHLSQNLILFIGAVGKSFLNLKKLNHVQIKTCGTGEQPAHCDFHLPTLWTASRQ